MVALGLMASMFQVFTTPHPAFAGVGNYRPATWNMQGGNSGTMSKWTAEVPQLMRSGYNVIALQEAGPTPPWSAWWVGRHNWLAPSQNWRGWNVDEYRWRPLGQNHDWRIFFMRTDFSNSNRVNLAIVTDQYVQNVVVANAARFGRNGLPTSRPALGITMGDNTQFFTVHALSGGGVDATQLIANIAWVADWRRFAALGDWNRVPGRLNAGGRFKYTSNVDTHPSSNNELDYMVSNEVLMGYGGAATNIHSDHVAIAFHRLQANAGVQLLNVHDHNLSMSSNDTVWGSPIVSGGWPNFSSWRFELRGGNTGTAYRVVNNKTGLCMSDSNGHLIQWGCNGASDQLFELYNFDGSSNIQMRPENRTWQCVGDDHVDGWGSWIRTDDDCHSGQTRLGWRNDYDPGPDAAPVLF